MKRERVTKPRTRVRRRTGTEIHDDARTQRERDRGAAKRAAIEREIEEIREDLDLLLEEEA